MPTAGQKRKTRGTNIQNNALPPHVVRTTHNSTRYDNYALITPLWIFIWKYILFYFNFLLARLLCFAQEFRLFFFARFFLVFAPIVSTFLIAHLLYTASQLMSLSWCCSIFLLLLPKTLPLKQRGESNILCTPTLYASRGSLIFLPYSSQWLWSTVVCRFRSVGFLPSRIVCCWVCLFSRFRWHPFLPCKLFRPRNWHRLWLKW